MFRVLAAVRSLVFPLIVGLIIFLSAGTWNLPGVWGVLAVLSALCVVTAATAAPDLLKERLSPGEGNQDRLTRRLAAFLMPAHWILAGLDIGRYRWSPVAESLQVSCLIGYAVSVSAIFYTMRTNRFYSSVVRIQADRGHEVISSGPYRFVRHPGYAASLVAFLCGGLATGSWVAMIPIAVMLPLFVRRTLVEEAMLLSELPGYAEYAQRVRYRFIPGLF